MRRVGNVDMLKHMLFGGGSSINGNPGNPWVATLGGSDIDYSQSVAVASDGSVYVCGYTNSAGAGNNDLLLAKITDSLIEQDTVAFGSFTFQDASLTANNVSLTITSSSLPVSDAGLTVKNSSLTVGTPSLTTNLYTL